ncbi:MAG TPA: alpha/beta fold hydrolase [Chthonomonas sp.]|uniref:RBBP9/YdeN family alpha/beta hydrolase n=1 Tax=Chthonomonas sp. TaxID=2282153 RepID=UPI002B4AF267|nr:alpha/beta fold hydrolase [Chthonomonas sp.]HLI47091.1 alpha/beta fold hydrolase [Chthonomonas sp.]
MENRVVLILHGWGGNAPEHWQEHLYERLTAEQVPVYYPEMPNPSAPDLNAWLNAIRREIGMIRDHHEGEPLTVVAHSLGCIAWIHLVSSCGTDAEPIAERVLLVAPPYIMPQAPPTEAPVGVSSFYPLPIYPGVLHAVCPLTVLIASNNDDYATFDQSAGLAQALGIPIYKLESAGHISPYYGYGKWPWVEEWCLGRAELPPQPR